MALAVAACADTPKPESELGRAAARARPRPARRATLPSTSAISSISPPTASICRRKPSRRSPIRRAGCSSIRSTPSPSRATPTSAAPASTISRWARSGRRPCATSWPRTASMPAHPHDLLRQGAAGGGVQRHLLLVAESPRPDRAQQPPRSSVLADTLQPKFGPNAGAVLPSTRQCRAGERSDVAPKAVGRLRRGRRDTFAFDAGGAQQKSACNSALRHGRAAEFQSQVGDRVFFSEGSAELGARARTALEAQAAWLKRHPALAVTVEGHADDAGAVSHNLEVSRRRAEAVRRRLIESGVAPERIRIAAYGRERPIARCGEPGCAAQNRRAVTVVAQPPPPRPRRQSAQEPRYRRQAVAPPPLLSADCALPALESHVEECKVERDRDRLPRAERVPVRLQQGTRSKAS